MNPNVIQLRLKALLENGLLNDPATRDALLQAVREMAAASNPDSNATPGWMLELSPKDLYPTEPYSNPVPSQEVSANIPHDTFIEGSPRTPGIPERTVKAHTENRTGGLQGFATGAGEAERGRLQGEREKTAVGASAQQETLRHRQIMNAPIDRRVPGETETRGVPAERAQMNPLRAYKAVPRKSVYLPH